MLRPRPRHTCGPVLGHDPAHPAGEKVEHRGSVGVVGSTAEHRRRERIDQPIDHRRQWAGDRRHRMRNVFRYMFRRVDVHFRQRV